MSAGLIERAVDAHLDVYTRSPEFKAVLTRLVKWGVQGYANGCGVDERKAFTASVADRIHDKARAGRVKFLGFNLWLYRYPRDWCAERAEEVVTEWLRDERIKFGDSRFYWSDGHAIADEEMSHWEPLT